MKSITCIGLQIRLIDESLLIFITKLYNNNAICIIITIHRFKVKGLFIQNDVSKRYTEMPVTVQHKSPPPPAPQVHNQQPQLLSSKDRNGSGLPGTASSETGPLTSTQQTSPSFLQQNMLCLKQCG